MAGWNSPTREDTMRFDVAGIALAFCLITVPALADDTIKIGYIDPLSGGGASIGAVGLKTYQYLADEINTSGGLLGKKVEIVAFDNKTNPQESLIQAQKAADQGIRIITQGNGSSVAAALSDWVTKYNDRNPGKEIVYLNYAAVDPVLTNDGFVTPTVAGVSFAGKMADGDLVRSPPIPA
jgi:branched-chain amino acid transport system substrate-binding protein